MSTVQAESSNCLDNIRGFRDCFNTSAAGWKEWTILGDTNGSEESINTSDKFAALVILCID